MKIGRLPINLLLAVSIVVSITSCEKDYSFEGSPLGSGPGGSAIFSLVPTASNCTDATLSGIFEEGLALGADALMTLTVDVTQAGSWTYSTATVDGFVFAGSGNFATTGLQTIVLKATGTPTVSGDFIFRLNIGSNPCDVVVLVSPPAGSVAEFYYKANIAGTDYYQPVTANNNYEATAGMGGLDEVQFSAGISHITQPPPAGKTEMYVYKGVMRNYLSATETDFKAYFTPGAYPYAPSGFSSGDGVTVYWRDPSGTYWTTRHGPVDQPGSNFRIVSISDAHDASGVYYVKVMMKFNCKLYKDNTATVLELRDGEMVAAFAKLQ